MPTPVEDIKSRLDIVSFVQGYLKLERAGANLKARCPFHSEKSPSFFVSPSRDRWHCFGCGKGGDVFQFLMEFEHVEFAEALRMLAERTGVELRGIDPKERNERTRLLQLLEDATQYFMDALLRTPEALAYLKERGVTDEAIKDFRLGFAPEGWRNLLAHLRGKEYTPSEMERVGLVLRKEGARADGEDGFYDRFRSRIIFPLIDQAGRTIGFGGRIFGVSGESGEGGAKYINSPQTIFYDKSRFLYNFSHARQDIAKVGTAVIVEGYMDVILSHVAGVTNVVGVSGTALTREHLRAVKRFTDTVAFAFDMDRAGVSASRRAVELAAEEDFIVRLVEISSGKDPADLARESSEAWKRAVKEATPSVAFFLRRAIEAHGITDAHAKRKVGEAILPLVARIPNEMEKAHWVREISRAVGIPEQSCWNELLRVERKIAASPTQSVGAAPASSGPEKLSRMERLERMILGFLLFNTEFLRIARRVPDEASAASHDLAPLFRYFAMSEGNCPSREDVLQQMQQTERAVAEAILFETEELARSFTDLEREFSLLIDSWEIEWKKRKLKALESDIRIAETAGDTAKAEAILRDIHTLTKPT